MLNVYIAITQRSNPGPSCVGVVGVVDGATYPYARIVSGGDAVTNYHALWSGVDLAIERARGRAITIWTTQASIGGVEGRARAGGSGLQYGALAESCRVRLIESGSVVRFVCDNDAPEPMRLAKSKAVAELSSWASRCASAS